MKCSIVVAAAENMAIGKGNDLIWSLPRDLRFFMQLTMGAPMLMGRKTFESLGKPLKGRKHIVISRSYTYNHEQVIVLPSIEAGIQWAAQNGDEQLFITGGGTIYEYCLIKNLVDKVFLTTVHAHFDADTFLTGFDKEKWNLLTSTHYEPDDKNSLAMTFQQFVTS